MTWIYSTPGDEGQIVYFPKMHCFFGPRKIPGPKIFGPPGHSTNYHSGKIAPKRNTATHVQVVRKSCIYNVAISRMNNKNTLVNIFVSFLIAYSYITTKSRNGKKMCFKM